MLMPILAKGPNDRRSPKYEKGVKKEKVAKQKPLKPEWQKQWLTSPQNNKVTSKQASGPRKPQRMKW